jgi:membrane associated rhomboid family serine protease
MPSESRDYFREGQGGGYRFEGWAGTRVTWTLILVQGVLWLVYAGTVNRLSPGGTLHEVFALWLSLWLPGIEQGRLWQVGTYFWFHDPRAIVALAYSLAFLFFFGRPLEKEIGGSRYLRLYLGGGLVAGLLAVPWFAILGFHGSHATASAAVYAVTIGHLLRRRDETSFFGVPAWGLAAFLVGFHVVSAFVIPSGEVYSFFPIVGAGVGWLHLRALPRLDAFRERTAEARRLRADARDAATREEDRRRVDGLLEKIEREGIGALSEREKDFLQQAAKRRRGG